MLEIEAGGSQIPISNKPSLTVYELEYHTVEYRVASTILLCREKTHRHHRRRRGTVGCHMHVLYKTAVDVTYQKRGEHAKKATAGVRK